jgi:hypothetical protein
MRCADCPITFACPYSKCEFEEGGAFYFPVGRVIPSQVEFVPANPLRDVMIDDTTMIVYAEPARKGWVCPKCDNAVSPDEKTCPHCKPKPKKESAGGERTHITETD